MQRKNFAAMPDEKEEYVPESWYIHPAIRAAADRAIVETGKPYALVPAGDYDIQKVVSSYSLTPVPGQSIKSVHVIYNPRLNRKFGLELDTLNARHGEPAFSAKWRDEKGKSGEWRQTTHQLLEALAAPHHDTNNPHVTLLPMWHATNAEILPSLFKTGFANLAMVDSGFFGRGIYSAGEARYAQTVYGKMHATPALLMNWVASYSAYPVIHGDMDELEGKGNYANHDAHFIPVRPANPKDPYETNFYPCRIGENPTYTEMVVFQSAQCLPRYLVGLQPSFFKPIPTPNQVMAFLRLVAEGEQDKAEAMLKANSGLALQSGTVTDLSDRTFKHITGFQYAVWAMDWHMWTMLLNYLPREEAALQLQALETNGTEHGTHFDLNHLVGALDNYVKGYDGWNSQQRQTQWCQQVGGAQRILPAHVVNEYCRRDRSFDPVPDFTSGNLPRVRTVYVNKRDDEWFSVVYKGGSVGDTFAMRRGQGAAAHGRWGGCVAIRRDRDAVQMLMKSRKQQLQGLKTDLLQNNPVVAMKGKA